MKATKLITALLFAAVMSMILSAVAPDVNPVVMFASLLLIACIPTPRGVLNMALTVEIWETDVVENLYKDNMFATFCFNADQYVLKGKVVHIPVAGAPGQVKKNLAAFPQAALKRTDNDITYAIDTFYLLPRHIEDIEKYELSYDKRQSVVGEDQAFLIQCAMDSLLYRWAPLVAKTLLTDGIATPATLAGAAGNRLKFTKEAFEAIFLLLNAANISPNGRVALLTAHHYSQFMASLTPGEKTDVGRVVDLKNGVIGEYLGFKIMMRSEVLRYRGADGAFAVVDELDEAYAADPDDRAASLFWQKDAVERAFGQVKMFDNPGRAEYFGDIFSMTLRLGGRIRRANGVYAVVEALAA